MALIIFIHYHTYLLSLLDSAVCGKKGIMEKTLVRKDEFLI